MGFPSDGDTVLQPGRILSWMRPPWEEPGTPHSFAILYRDEHLLAVAARGLPTIPSGGVSWSIRFGASSEDASPQPAPCTVWGGTSESFFSQSRPKLPLKFLRWRSGQVPKVYRALASGCPARDEFEIDIPIGKVPHPVLKTIHAACPAGKPAHSRVRVLERRDGCSCFKSVSRPAGRTQIRIHMAASGHPLVGDPLYLVGGVPAEDSRALPGNLGYHLHSALLGFPHPATDRWIEITCAPPPTLRLRNLDPMFLEHETPE
jgi:23S rRNA pseudouridine1911/1915/1917 synthase